MSIDQKLSGDPRSPRFTILRVEGDDAWCRLDNPYLDAFRTGDDDDNASIRPYLCMASIAPTNRARCGKCSKRSVKAHRESVCRTSGADRISAT